MHLCGPFLHRCPYYRPPFSSVGPVGCPIGRCVRRRTALWGPGSGLIATGTTYSTHTTVRQIERNSVPGGGDGGVWSSEDSNHDCLPQAPQCPVPQQLHVPNRPVHRRSSSSTSDYVPALSTVTQSPKRRHKRFVSDGSELSWISATFSLATGSLSASHHDNKSTTKQQQQQLSKIDQKPGHKRHSSNRSFSLLPRRRGRVEELPDALDVGNENTRTAI